MKEIKDQTFSGERAEFMAKDTKYISCTFEDGESPLKHSENINAVGCDFKWKYPFWYSSDINVSDCTFHEMGRAGVWYGKNVSFERVKYIAPKGFRRCDGLTLNDVCIPFAQETLWHCRNVTLKNIKATGDYLAMNCENMEIDGLTLDGNYSFDGAKNITVKNSVLNSKDAFWNSENIVCENCKIVGEYIGWNSKNLRFINCEIESLQGLCFIEGLYMRGCTLNETTLCFEYCSDIDAEIKGHIESVKNPSSGIIKAGSIGELIMESERVDTAKTKIITE
ncbi:MAG: DUF3737 family protein [Ruminococcus sp.]|nr:DUF3737 family protein [Ruminococcus sp.]